MRFDETPLPGVLIVDPDVFADERGSFAALFRADEFAVRGIPFAVDQAAVSRNSAKGTLRGLHFQAEPHAQGKLVACTRGSIFDVVVDVRPDSPTRGRWFGLDLSADNRRLICVPRGCAHGFITLEGATDVSYLIEGRYSPEHERGLRWDDPVLGITWPLSPTTISDRDRSFPLLTSGGA